MHPIRNQKPIKDKWRSLLFQYHWVVISVSHNVDAITIEEYRWACDNYLINMHIFASYNYCLYLFTVTHLVMGLIKMTYYSRSLSHLKDACQSYSCHSYANILMAEAMGWGVLSFWFLVWVSSLRYKLIQWDLMISQKGSKKDLQTRKKGVNQI